MHVRVITKLSIPFSASLLLLACLFLSGCGGVATQSTSTQQTVVPVPVVSLTVRPAAVLPGQNATLTWSATSANSCTADGAWSGGQQMNGSMNVSLSSSTAQTYALNCTNSAGQAVRSSVTLALSPADGACTASHAVAATAKRAGKRRAPNSGRS